MNELTKYVEDRQDYYSFGLYKAETQHWPRRANVKPPAGLVVRDFELDGYNVVQKYTENAKILLNSITILSGIANSIDNSYINGSIYREIHQPTKI